MIHQIMGIQTGLQPEKAAVRKRLEEPQLPGIKFGAERDVLEHYQKSGTPVGRQTANLIRWYQNERPKLLEEGVHYIPGKQKATPADPKRMAENVQTLKLVEKRFDSIFSSGVEPANVVTPGGFRWDMYEVMGLYDDQKLKELVKSVERTGVKTLRIGIPSHLIVKSPPKTGIRFIDQRVRQAALKAMNKGLYSYHWEAFDKLYKAFKSAYDGKGIKLIVDITHFGLPEIFDNPADRSKSYFQNPAWPDFLKNMTLEVVKRYPDVEGITLVNEVEVTNVFSNVLWNEAWPGRWDHPYFDRAIIDKALLIGKATAKTRLALEEHTLKQPDPEAFRKVLFNVEASNRQMQHTNGNYKTANKIMRFIHSDLILGQDWLYRADLDQLATVPLHELKQQLDKLDFDQTGPLEWMLSRYIFAQDPDAPPATGEEREALRQKLIGSLKEIREMHADFEKRFGKTIKADTVFGTNYYTQTEGNHTQSPKEHLNELKYGGKRGLVNLMIDYWNRHHLPMAVTETGTPFPDQSDLWGKQMAMELTEVMLTELDGNPQAAREAGHPVGIPVVNLSYYPFYPTKGWEHGLNRPASESVLNNAGLVDEQFKPINTLPEFFRALETRSENS